MGARLSPRRARQRVATGGRTLQPSLVLGAARDTLDAFRALLGEASTVMMVSVAYPEENLPMGDNVRQAEAALLWVKHVAGRQPGVRIRHVFLGGRSQGGFLVTRLNALHPTRGVIASGPGPLDLVFRCGLEEAGRQAPGEHCTRLRDAYGSTVATPAAYASRSLRSFTSGYTSDIPFVQGFEDTPIQRHGWTAFAREVAAPRPSAYAAGRRSGSGGGPANIASASSIDDAFSSRS